jgi:hypothetical protein
VRAVRHASTLALIALAACLAASLVACARSHRSTAPEEAATAGISIALYAEPSGGAYGVVEDRRWIEITGHELMIDRIDPGAALASLVIEPLGASDLHITQCVRERLPELPPVVPKAALELTSPNAMNEKRAALLPRPRRKSAFDPPPPAPLSKHPSSAVPPPDRVDTSVRCQAEGAPGRHLIRILYVSTTLVYRAQHDVAMVAADRATVTTRVAITTPAWRTRGEVVAFDGAPGGQELPHEIARGQVVLDGSVAIVEVAPHEVAAELRRVYDGAIATPDLPAADMGWNRESTQFVWVWLELAKLHLAPGAFHVHVELPNEGIRDVDVPAAGRRQADRPDAPLRLPLWVDDTLIGSRQRFGDTATDELAERLMLSVANTSDTSREVWLEEHVRPARHRRVERAWPTKPSSSGDLVRHKVAVAPHKIERVGYTLVYDF